MRPFTAAILISIANLLAWLSLLYHSRNFRWKWTPMEGYLSSIGTWTSETDIVVGNASGNEYLGMISIKKLETRRIIANWNICRSLIGIWIMSRYKCKSLCKSKGVWTTLCMNLSLIDHIATLNLQTISYDGKGKASMCLDEKVNTE